MDNNGEIQYRSGEDPTLLVSNIFDKSLIGQLVSGPIIQNFSYGLFIAAGVKNSGTLNENFTYHNYEHFVKGTISDIPCNSMFAYHGSSFYYFSGSYYINKSKVFNLLPRAKFAKFDLGSMCENYNCTFECSPGFVLKESMCVICPPGTYLYNNTCIPCNKGYFNPLQGASSIFQCYPCPEGSYNDKQGSSLCKICPIGYVCYAGSTAPELLKAKSEILMSEVSSDKAKEHGREVEYFMIFIGFSISFILFIYYFRSDRFRKLITKLDLFQSIHNHEIGEKIHLQKNLLGATFTVLFYISFACIGSNMIYYYFMQNQNKEYSLVPLVLLDNIFKDFQADFEVSVRIKKYADQCIISNKTGILETLVFTKCSDNILISIENLKRQKISNKCMLLNDNSCLVKISCEKCRIDKSSKINFIFKGDFSYSSGFLVNFTSNSYITKSHQTSLSEIYPNKNNVFAGINPSVLTFLLTPSLCEVSEFFEITYLTGYQSQVYMLPIEGSERNVKDLFLPSELRLKIVLKKDDHGLLSKISIKENFFSLLGGLFGSFNGLMTLFVFSIIMCEKVGKRNVLNKSISQSQDVIKQRMHFISVFRDFIVDVSKEENMFPMSSVPSTEN